MSWLGEQWKSTVEDDVLTLAGNPDDDQDLHIIEGLEAPADAPVQFPAKLQALFERAKRHEPGYRHRRYKVAKGGRGGAKSWGFARALLVLGMSEPLRIGIFRQVQKSIRESVHQLL